MVGIAQQVEHLVVVQDVAGSSPVTHPRKAGASNGPGFAFTHSLPISRDFSRSETHAVARRGYLGGMTNDELTRRAAKAGLTLSYMTINGLAAGTYKSRPTAKTLAALEHLSDYTIEQVYAAAGLRVPLRPFTEDLPSDADTLSAEQRQAVLAVVRQFASANRALARLEREQVDGSHAQGTPNRRAAGSAAHEHDVEDASAPPTENDYGWAVKRGRCQRAFDDQSAHASEA